MQWKTPKLLEDIRASAEFIRSATHGKALADYRSDRMLRAAVERHFEIIGGAINRLAKIDPDTADRIDDHSRIVAFRNILIHGYDLVDDDHVWQVIERHVPALEQQVIGLLKEC